MAFDIAAGITKTQPVLIVVENIDAKVSGPVLLGTVPTGSKIIVPFWAGVSIDTIAGLTTAPTISIGTNSAAYDNMVAATLLTGLLQGRVAPVVFKAQYPVLTPNTQVFLNISVGAVATTYKIIIGLMGFGV